MAGYAEALASLLYPNSPSSSYYTLGGQAVGNFTLPTFKNPWATALASGLQGLIAGGLQGYGVRSANQANAENAAAMVPQLTAMGVKVTPEVEKALTSEDPKTRSLALALIDKQMTQADAIKNNDADFEKYKRQQDYIQTLKNQEEAAKRPAEQDKFKFDQESKLRSEIEGKPLEVFNETTRTFSTMLDEVKRDDRASDISLIASIAKLRDPTSVVRESEFNVNKDTASLLEKEFGNLRGVVMGSGTLSPETRAKIIDSAKNYWEGSRANYESAARPRAEIATRRGLDVANVITVPYSRDAYKDLLSKVPTAADIRKAYEERAKAASAAASAPTIGRAQQRPELLPTPVAAAQMGAEALPRPHIDPVSGHVYRYNPATGAWE